VKSRTTWSFRKQLASLPQEIRNQASSAYELFVANPRHPSLHFKRVHTTEPVVSASVDAIVIGRNTFEKVLTFGAWPYGDKRVVVLSSRPVDLSAARGGVVEQMAGPPTEIVSRLAARGVHHLYVDGGITIQRFLQAGLIQRLMITRVPCSSETGFLSSGRCSATFGYVTWRRGISRAAWFRASTLLPAHSRAMEKGGADTMAKKSRGGRMTAAKRRAAKSPGGKGRVKKRKAGRNIMKT
jgi:dihydrofolate reductase